MPVELKVPSVGESITEVQIGEWYKKEGDTVQLDENVVEVESEKATFEIPAPASGVVSKISKRTGETAAIGEVIGYLDEAKAEAETKSAGGRRPRTRQKSERKEEAVSTVAPAPTASEPAPAEPPAEEPRVMPSARRLLEEYGLQAGDVRPTGPGGRLLKEDVLRHLEEEQEAQEPERPFTERESPAPPEAVSEEAEPPRQQVGGDGAAREEDVVPMSPLRRRIAQRLVEAQRQAALLTTFNEIDMSEVMQLRKQFREVFEKKYSVKLGVMSFFVKAVIDALMQFPQLNAEIRENEIVFKNYYDIGIAVGGGKGLVVPVLRNAERMSFAEIEQTIGDLARRAQQNKLSIEELTGGTFTISNGGVYGSLLSTPIVNPPQSGVLGMHAIQDRPVVVDGNVVVRPMMYIALTYDHRIVDGREAVTFLKRIKEVVENPARMLIEA